MKNDKNEKRGRKRKTFKEFFAIRHLRMSELMTLCFYMFLSMLSGARGLTLIQITEEEVSRSDMYTSLTAYMSIEVWGGLLIVASITLAFSAIISGRPNYTLAVPSNLILAILFFLLSAAAYENGSSILNFYNHTIILTAHTVLAGLGVAALCRNRKNM